MDVLKVTSIIYIMFEMWESNYIPEAIYQHEMMIYFIKNNLSVTRIPTKTSRTEIVYLMNSSDKFSHLQRINQLKQLLIKNVYYLIL